MLSESHRTLVFWTLMIAAFATSMAFSSMSIMLPPIMETFGIPTNTAQWLISGAALVSGIMIPVAAFLIKLLPNRNFFILAITMFFLGSLLGAIANHFYLVLAGRLIQALGGGLLMPFSQIILLSIYPREKHGTAMGNFTLSALIAPVVSPYVAGLVIDNLGWQFMFYIFGALCFVCIVFGFVFMKNITKKFIESFSGISVALSSLGVLGLLIGLSNLSNYNFLRLETGGVLLAGLVLLFLFVLLQFRLPNPLLDLRILRNRSFRTALFIAITMYMAYMGGGVLMPIYGQTIRGFSATAYAIIILPGSVFMALITALSGRIYDRRGPKFVTCTGASFLCLGNIFGIMLDMESSLFFIGLTSFMLSVGIGFLLSPIAPMALSDLDDKGRVDGSAILGSIRQIINSISITYTILLFTVFSSMYDSIIGLRSSFISSLGFGIILLMIAVFSVKKSTVNKLT